MRPVIRIGLLADILDTNHNVIKSRAEKLHLFVFKCNNRRYLFKEHAICIATTFFDANEEIIDEINLRF